MGSDVVQEAGRLPAEARELLELVCRQIIQELGVTSCSLSQWDRNRNVVTTQITYAVQPNRENLRFHGDAGTDYPLEAYPATARVLQERVSIAVRADDPTADPAELAYLREMGQQTNLMLPLMVGDKVIGLLEIYQRDRPRTFTPEELERAWSLARQAALVVEGSHLFVEARREAEDLVALAEATSAIFSRLELEAVLRTAAEQLVRIVGVEGCILSRYDPGKEAVQTWVEYTSQGVKTWAYDMPEASYALADYPLTARVLRERVPAVVQADDPSADPAERALMAKTGVRSLLMLPLQAYGQVIGLVELASSYRRDFGPREIRLARALADQAAIAIENARLYAQVQEQLAGLRRAHEDQARLLETVREMGTPVIPVHERILVLPLIGPVDSDRARRFTERMLEAVRRQRAQVVLVDITGVPLVDTAVAQALLRAAEAVRLLGAEMVLVGVRSEVAQTLVMLGVDMSAVVSRGTLQSGVEYALGRLGLAIVPQEGGMG
ncbi:MAG: GAF domain-containing protein [Chloroflexia bacterium]